MNEVKPHYSWARKTILKSNIYGCYMKTNNSPISLLQTQSNTYNVLNNIQVHVEVRDNPYNLALDNLFQMAARINKKRSFYL